MISIHFLLGVFMKEYTNYSLVLVLGMFCFFELGANQNNSFSIRSFFKTMILGFSVVGQAAPTPVPVKTSAAFVSQSCCDKVSLKARYNCFLNKYNAEKIAENDLRFTQIYQKFMIAHDAAWAASDCDLQLTLVF